MLRVCAAAALSAILALGSSCGSDEPERPPAAQEERFSHARSLFREICAGCHTLASAGTHGEPSNIDDSVLRTISRAGRESVIRDALSSQWVMPRWRGVLSERDYEELVVFIRETTGRDRIR